MREVKFFLAIRRKCKLRYLLRSDKACTGNDLSGNGWAEVGGRGRKKTLALLEIIAFDSMPATEHSGHLLATAVRPSLIAYLTNLAILSIDSFFIN